MNIEQILEEAWTKRREGKYKEALFLVQKAQKNCEANDFNSLGRIFHLYMQFESDHGHPSKALEWCQKSLSCYVETGNKNKIAHAMRHVADLQRDLGMEEEAKRNYQEAIKMYRDSSNVNKLALANALRGFGLLLERRGKIEESIIIWKETQALYACCKLQAGVEESNQKLDELLKKKYF